MRCRALGFLRYVTFTSAVSVSVFPVPAVFPPLEWNGMGKDGKGWMRLFSLSLCLDSLVRYVLIMGDLELPFSNLCIDPFAPL
jgi:hypothetical protein|nr:hypothetical protein Q903MT_gene3588 [Picea sitchensis]